MSVDHYVYVGPVVVLKLKNARKKVTDTFCPKDRKHKIHEGDKFCGQCGAEAVVHTVYVQCEDRAGFRDWLHELDEDQYNEFEDILFVPNCGADDGTYETVMPNFRSKKWPGDVLEGAVPTLLTPDGIRDAIDAFLNDPRYQNILDALEVDFPDLQFRYAIVPYAN